MYIINFSVEELKKSLKDFSSFKDIDYDETFEAVLKNEYDIMKKALEKRIKELEAELKSQRL